MKKFLKVTAAFVAGLALSAGLASATVAPGFYAGFNPQSNQNGVPGLLVSGGIAPSASASTCSSGTVPVKGGASYGEVDTTVCTTLVLVLTGQASSLVYSNSGGSSGYGGGANQTNTPAPPTGAICESYDVTTPSHNTVSGAWNVGTFAFVGSGTTYSGYTCTFASITVTASDVILYKISAY